MSADWSWPPLEGLPVVDANGVKLGWVDRVEGDHLRVELRGRVERRLRVASHVLAVPLASVVDADDHEVTLREEAAYLARPEATPHEPVGRTGRA
jgi:hypothetical protein